MQHNALPPLIIRADGNARVGTGHVMRTLALAQYWVEMGGAAEFLTAADDRLSSRIEGFGFPVRRIQHSYPHPQDIDLMTARVRERARSWVCVDGYHFDLEYHRAIRTAGAKAIVMDDFAHLPAYEAEIVLNQNAGADELVYPLSREAIVLAGPRWALLRSEFRNAKRNTPRTVSNRRRLLITLGGADPANVTSRVVRALNRPECSKWDIVVLLGPSNPHREGVVAAVADMNNVRIEVDARNVPDWMVWADMCLSAAGSTCWELCFMGVPTAVVVLADNQRIVAQALSRGGAALDLGWHESISEREFGDALVALSNGEERRATYARRGRELVDGRGVERVAGLVRALTGGLEKNALEPRLATPDDCLAVWRFANDRGVRDNSFHPAAIPLDSHLAWYAEKLGDPRERLFLFEVSGTLVAQVRYARIAPDLAEVHFGVAAPFRGHGIGPLALNKTYRLACAQLGVTRLYGVALESNEASARTFIKAGYEYVGNVTLHDRVCRRFEKRCD